MVSGRVMAFPFISYLKIEISKIIGLNIGTDTHIAIMLMIQHFGVQLKTWKLLVLYNKKVAWIFSTCDHLIIK